MQIYFSDYFNVDKNIISEYGAFNISLINDLPVFIDPFLLFTSEKKEYRLLHDNIIEYIAFLRDMSQDGKIKQGLLKSWFLFPEIKQSWLGYSKTGNGGSGLGSKFAKALNDNLHSIFSNFGNEDVTRGSHLEKLCLIKSDVGKDNISDFTANLIKGFLCEYTETFAIKYLEKYQIKKVIVNHSHFNYNTRTWISKEYELPYIDNDYVLLTPRDMLTKDDNWINKHDLIADYESIASSIDNQQLRAQIDDYFLRVLPKQATKKEVDNAKVSTVLTFPALVDYYIRYKEDNGDKAKELSDVNLRETESIFIDNLKKLVDEIEKKDNFSQIPWDTFEETYQRVIYLKNVIENNDGYKVFYLNGEAIKRESDMQLMFRLTWFATPSDFNTEVNNGRGPVDFKVSRGFKDKTLVEFKLASNSKLKQNLLKQLEVYEEANQTKKSIKVIMYFSDKELERVKKILNDLEFIENKSLVLIDARNNKESASNVKISLFDI